MAPRRKSAKAELIVAQPPDAAVNEVRAWIVEGEQAAEILARIRKRFPKMRADVLLGLALDELRAEAEELDGPAARGFLLSAYREIYRKTLEANDFPTALSALRSFERQAGI